jgi:predicted N-formylglutamate amidohydrolase
MDGTDYTAPVHRRGRGIDAVELEVRQDLLQDAASARRIADLFVRLLPTVAPGMAP